MGPRADVLAAIPRRAIRTIREGDGWSDHYYLGDVRVDEHVRALIDEGLVVNTVTGLRVTQAGQDRLYQLRDGRDLTD